MSLLSALFGPQKLTPLERQVIAVVSTKLPMNARQMFEAQVNRINRIQRHPSGKEANFYILRRGKPFVDEEILFPLRSESLLATVHLTLGQGRNPLRAEVWLVDGRVFSVDFNKPPEKIQENEIHVTSVEIKCDPMIVETGDPLLDADRRDRVVKEIHSKLPEGYLQVVGDRKMISVNDWSVAGIEDVRKIVQKDGNYYLLAEKAGMGAIGIKEDEWSGQLYFLDLGDDEAEEVTIGFRKFLEG